MTPYAAFLLGINVGGHRRVPMAELKKVLEREGFERVKTFLASGNVLLEAEGAAAAVAARLECIIREAFGFEVGVIVRSVKDLRALADRQPFKRVKVTPATRRYVTFLASKSSPSIAIPYASPDKSLRILEVTPTEVISVLTVGDGKGTVDAMKIFANEFGKKITTRNWNTIEKMLA